MTVPGVNVVVAATFMAAVGDIRRFADRRKLTAYLGLDPRVRLRRRARHPRPHLQAGLQQRAPRARRGVLVDRAPARTDPRLLSARAGASRSLDRHRRQRTQAGVAVLVPADPRRGLRLRATVADQEEDAPPRAHRRRPALPGRPRRLVDQRRAAPRRTRTRPPSPARLRTHGQRPPTKKKGASATSGRASRGSSKEQVARQTPRPKSAL